MSDQKYGVSEETVNIQETHHTFQKKQINWDGVTRAQTAKNAQGNLELVQEKVAKFEPFPETVPFVSIITVTRNRKHLFPIAIQSWLQLSYPKQKLEWLIIDDSDKPNQRLDDMLENLMKMGHDIKYVLLNNVCSVGRKRNLGVELSKYPYIMMMDDDDVYYHDSIISKLASIITYGKKIAFSRPIAVYDIKNDQSYVLEGFQDVPEASLMFTRDFWFNNGKFDDDAKSGEGHALLAGNEHFAIEVPFFFNFLCLQHSENATQRLRTYNRLLGRRGMSRVNQMRSMKAQRNFFKDLPKYFKELLTQIFENQEKKKKELKEMPTVVPSDNANQVTEKKKKNKKKKNKKQ